jgi:tRNA(adenine34) deaminase
MPDRVLARYTGVVMSDTRHERFMRLALDEARRAASAGEVPVGALVVLGDEILGSGSNRPIGSCDPTAHAEVVALREAAQRVGNYRLVGADVYVTVEPCLMCVGAMVHARVRTVVFGAREPKAGALGSMVDALTFPSLNHRFAVVEGVLEEECRGVLQAFFASRRGVV